MFAGAVDAFQAVDLCCDAMMSEIDNGKMRVFLSDVMFDVERGGKGGRVYIPLGKADCTVFRKVMSTENTIHEFAPALRTEDQAQAFRVALQTLGDLCGFGINYFDLENVSYVKTATEVSADNSAPMRNIRRHEHALEGAIAGICRALLAVGRHLGVELPDEGLVCHVRRQHHLGHGERQSTGHGRGGRRAHAAVGVSSQVVRRGRGDRAPGIARRKRAPVVGRGYHSLIDTYFFVKVMFLCCDGLQSSLHR